MVVKDTVSPEGSRADHMSVGQDVTPLRIDHKPRRLAAHGQVRIEGAGLAEVDGHDALHHGLDRGLPLGRVGRGRPQGQHARVVLLVILDVVDGPVGRRGVSGRQLRGLGLEVFRGALSVRDGAVLALRAGLAVHLHAGRGREAAGGAKRAEPGPGSTQ